MCLPLPISRSPQWLHSSATSLSNFSERNSKQCWLSFCFGLLLQRKLLIQLQVEFQHIHSRFAQKTQLPALSVLKHEPPQVVHLCSSLPGDSFKLELGGCGCNVRM